MSLMTVSKLRSILADNQAAHVAALGNYFAYGGTGKSGSLFETFGDRGDSGPSANNFTYIDCLAPSFLSVNIPPIAAYRIVEGDFAKSTAQKLALIPTDTALDETSWAAHGSTVDALFQELKKLDYVNWVKASKLISRKRPELVPVLDNVLYNAFDMSLKEHAKVTWPRIATFVSDAQIKTSLGAIQQAAIDQFTTMEFPNMLNLAGLSALSLIRVLDICVWEEHRTFNKKGKHPICLFQST